MMKNFTLNALLASIALLLFGQQNLLAQPDAAFCTEPATYNFTSVRDGAWSSASTWAGGVAPSANLSSNQKVLITHQVTKSGEFKPNSNTVIVVKDGGFLSAGQILMESTSTIIVKNAKLRVAGNLGQKVSGARICGTNACIIVTQNYQPESSSSGYFRSSGLDIGENFQVSSGTSISGSDIRVWVRSGSLQNSGTWTGTISFYRVSGSVSGIPASYRPAAQSSATVMAGVIEACNLILLPVSISSFSAQKQSREIKLQWVTAAEQNNAGFFIERSPDGITWKSIGFVPSQAANGNSHQNLSYNFCDRQPLAGKDFYRLDQNDFDGHHVYSETQLVKFETGTADVIIYPNPATTTATIQGLRMGETVSLYNTFGQCLKSFKASTAEHQVDLSRLLPSVYTITIADRQGKISGIHKIVKKV